MNEPKLSKAMAWLDEDLLCGAMEYLPKRAKRPAWTRWASLAACLCLVFLFAVPAYSELTNGYVSNLLAPLYGCAQTELVDRIGKPVGASVTVGDYRLTADAVIGDRFHYAVVYTLRRTDGGALPEGLGFQGYDTSMRGSGGACYQHILSEDSSELKIVQQVTQSKKMPLNRIVEVTFSDLCRYDGNTTTAIAEGDWNLKFCLRYEDTSVNIPVRNLKVTNAEGISYTIHKMTLSPVGIHLDMTVPNNYTDGKLYDAVFHGFTVAVVLGSGQVIPMEDRNMGRHGRGKWADADYGAFFEEPIDISNISEILICGTAVEIKK